RRPVADKYGGCTEGTRRQLHQGDVLSNREARDLLPTNSKRSRSRRAFDRLAYLGPQEFRTQDTRRGKARNRDGALRDSVGARRTANRALLPLPCSEASTRSREISW